MHAMHTCHLSLVLLSILLYQTSVEPTTIRCFFWENGTDGNSFVDVSDMNELSESCKKAVRIGLADGDVFNDPTISDGILNWILNVYEISMCVVIQRSTSNMISVRSKAFSGNCSGPLLRVVNNDYLAEFSIGAELLEYFAGSSEKIVIVRGNRNLSNHSINMLKKHTFVDLQEKGECATPLPFTDFESVKNCRQLYGPLSVNSTASSIFLPPSLKGKMEYEGCIDIRNTSLVDVNFLEAFSSFKKLQGCEQHMEGNKELCVSNLKFVTVFFNDIDVKDNKKLCEYCKGGHVTDEYLRLNAACKHVYGDLRIIGWEDIPPHVDVLMGLQSIDGQLIIENNRNLYNFSYFSNLTVVSGTGGNGPAIIVKDNLDLTELPFPLIDDLKEWGNKSRITFINNPRLRTSELPRAIPDEETTRKIEPRISSASVKAQKAQTLIKKTNVTDFVKWYVIGGAVLLCLFILPSILLVILRRKSRSILPPLQSRLSKRSEEVLSSLCKEIVNKNPMVWFCEDGNLLWNTVSKKADDGHSTFQDQFLESHMLSLSQNAGLPFVKRIDIDNLLQKRIQSFMEHDYVLLIGTSDNVKKVVPHLPLHVGGSMLFFDSPSNISLQFKLLDREHISRNIDRYIYEAGDVREKAKILNILYYKWTNERLPFEFDELLLLLWFSCRKNVICASNRHKEIFSILHLFFMVVVKLKEHLGLTETFQYHLCKCNGAPLDRNEMLIVMRIVLEWARKVSAVAPEIEEKCSNWCKIYEKMSAFSKNHRNIMHIHPQHIADDKFLLKKEANGTYSNAGNIFSERPYSAMSDIYRRLKHKKVCPQHKTMDRIRGLDASSASKTSTISVSVSSCNTTTAPSGTNVSTSSSTGVFTSSSTEQAISTTKTSTSTA